MDLRNAWKHQAVSIRDMWKFGVVHAQNGTCSSSALELSNDGRFHTSPDCSFVLQRSVVSQSLIQPACNQQNRRIIFTTQSAVAEKS